MSIRRRISIVAAVAVAITVFLVAVGSFVAARARVLAPIDQSLIERAEDARRIRPGDIEDGRLGRPGLLGLAIRPSDFDSVYYQVGLPSGRTLNLGRDGLILPAPSASDLAPPGPTLRSVWVDGVHLRVATVLNPSTNIYVQIARPLTEADETLAGFAAMLALGGLFVGFGARYAGGCTSGHAISGLSNLQWPSLLAVIGFFAGGMVMIYLLYPIIFG